MRGSDAGGAVERRVLLLDNYDSFTFNVVQALQMLGATVEVRRNDRTTLEAVRAWGPTHLVVSPGPGRPEDAGLSLALIGAFAGGLPVLGICLGHQAIAQALGGRVIAARRLMHGKTSHVRHLGEATTLFDGLRSPLPVGRYHSLAVEAETLPEALHAVAWDEEGEIMALEHATWPLFGVQFHPESVLTPDGPALLSRFLDVETPA